MQSYLEIEAMTSLKGLITDTEKKSGGESGMVREDPAIATLGVGLSEVSFYNHCTHGFIKG